MIILPPHFQLSLPTELSIGTVAIVAFSYNHALQLLAIYWNGAIVNLGEFKLI